MSEIKFACPYCHQHIACDGSYGDLCIECPACDRTMVVPRLTASETPHVSAVIVASTPAPARPPISPRPAAEAWTEKAWAENYRVTTGDDPEKFPLWIGSALGTLVTAFILKLNEVAPALIIGCLVAGALLSGFLLARNRGASGARTILNALMFAAALIVAIPLIGVGILFVGCAACR